MNYILEIRVAVPMSVLDAAMEGDRHPSDKLTELVNRVGDNLSSFPDNEENFPHQVDLLGEGELERTDDLTLEEGVEFLGGQGFTVLTADTPEDIDSWPPASEVFGGDDEVG